MQKMSEVQNIYFSLERLRAFYKQYLAFNRCKSKVESLVVGSSHGHYGFFPQKDEFNLCQTSQDLYYSYSLYHKWQDLPNLKMIFVFYSIFSPGHIVKKTIDKEYALFYKYFYKLPFKCRHNHYFAEARTLIMRALASFNEQVSDEYRGNASYAKYFCKNADAKERTSGHLKNSMRKDSQTVYVHKIAEIARQHGHKLYVIVPPARQDYMQFMPSFEQGFAELRALVARDNYIKLLNFFNDEDFKYSDFGDMDHLSLLGAFKLTTKIRDRIQ